MDQVTFSVARGEVFGLLGPNGGGKTTLFRILSTALKPQEGTARIFGADLAQDPGQARKRIGVVFQSPSLDKKLTAFENMRHQAHLYGLSGAAMRERIADLLKRMGLRARSEDRVETLSGGLMRRLEIAKSLLHGPELLLMDEPSTGLDPGARKDLWDYLFELKKGGVTVCVTTHLMEEAEKCDRVAILNEGKLVAINTPQALKAEIGGDVVTVQCRNPEALSEEIKRKFGVDAVIVDNSVRIEIRRGPEFIPQLAREFPNEILSVMLGKPTLEDVFIHRTGHRFWSELQSRSEN